MTDVTQGDNPDAINPIDESVSWDEAYEVVIYNDSETPIELVVELLMSHFLVLLNEASSIALRVHSDGHTGIGRLTEQTAQRVKDSMLMQSNQRGSSLRVEASRWAGARATTE